MHNIHLNDFREWNPSADDVHAPPGSLLRADNLVWDEQGQVALRRGLVELLHLDTAILNLYTADVQGSRRRFQCGNNGYVYLNGVRSVGPFNGDGDIVFGGANGMTYMARGTVKKKWNGVGPTGDIQNWGITPQTQAPTMVGVDGQITGVDAGNENFWSATEGSKAVGVGHDGGAGVKMICDVNSFRCAVQRVYYSGGSQQAQDYSGNPEDVIEVWIVSPNPDSIITIQVAFGMNPDLSNLFASDVYYYDYTLENDVRVQTNDQFISLDPDAEGEQRRKVVENLLTPNPIVSGMSHPPANKFVKLSAPRSAFLRSGGAPGRDWNTIYAVQVVVQYAAPAQTTTTAYSLTFDHIQIGRGRLTGTYFAKVQYVNQLPGYTAKSAITPASTAVTVKNGNLSVTIPPASDSQITEAWVFLIGGTLDRYYRFMTGAPGQTVTIAVSEREALVDNITFNQYLTTPPGDIIDILDGLHYGRLLVLTEYQLYVSQPNDPDSFATNEQIKIGEASGGSERNVWIARTLGGVYIGTTRDIYRLEGEGEEPVNVGEFIGFRVIPLHVEAPPMGQGTYPIGAVRAVATEGHTLVYMAADGPREFNGTTSVSLRGNTDLLWRWRDRYGVQKIDYNGRIRMTLNFGMLYIMVSEGTASSSVPWLYRLDMSKGAAGWSRFVLNSAQVVCLYREKVVLGSAGAIVLMGDENGKVYWLEGCDAADGAEGALPVAFWTPVGDNQQPLQRKEAMDFQCHFDVDGGQPATIALHLDQSQTPAISLLATQQPQTSGLVAYRQLLVGRIAAFTRVQFRVSGMFTRFKLYHLGMSYRLLPQTALARDTGFLDLSHGDLVWIRQAYIRVMARQTMRVIAYLDGVAFEATQIPVDAGEVIKYRVDFGRTAKGTQLRVLVFPVVKGATNADINPTPEVPTVTSQDVGQRIDEFSRMTNTTDPAAFRSRGANVGFFTDSGGGGGRAPSYPTGYYDGQEASAFELYDIRVQIRQSGNWTEKLIFRNTQPEERQG